MKLFFYALLSGIILGSCTAYKSSPFDVDELPVSPDYKADDSWAVLPNKIPNVLADFTPTQSTNLEVDVFFVYPTVFTSKKDRRWVASLKDESYRKDVLEKPVQFQSSAWYGVGNLYIPFYRQAHYRSFVEPYKKNGGDMSLSIAYSDVKRAFLYYLEHYNNGKPIIIASHSQGTVHAKQLIKEFFDGTPLQSKLIAAYLIGIGITPEEFSHIKPMTRPDQTGGFVSWNAYKYGKLPKNFSSWYKGGVTTNPVRWNGDKISNFDQHKGVLYSDKNIYAKCLTVEKANGLLWVTLPKIPKRFWLSFVKSYHFADINLFWEDIRQNTLLRVNTYLNP